jgi:peptide deformylase
MKHNWKPQLPPFRTNKHTVFSHVSKTGQFIYQIGEPLLRQPSKPVDPRDIPSDIFQQKIAYIKECMRKYREITGIGRGITAVQVGIPERFSVIYQPEKKEKLLIIINPQITKRSDKLLLYPEICMSANPLIAPVIRPAWVAFTYLDEQGRGQEWTTEDTTKEGRMYNRVFQHEIDHMDGMINIDKVLGKELIFDLDPHFYDKATFKEV